MEATKTYHAGPLGHAPEPKAHRYKLADSANCHLCNRMDSVGRLRSPRGTGQQDPLTRCCEAHPAIAKGPIRCFLQDHGRRQGEEGPTVALSPERPEPHETRKAGRGITPQETAPRHPGYRGPRDGQYMREIDRRDPPIPNYVT